MVLSLCLRGFGRLTRLSSLGWTNVHTQPLPCDSCCHTAHTQSYVHGHNLTGTHGHLHGHTHTRIHAYTHTRTLTYTPSHVHAHTLPPTSHVHAHTHAHTAGRLWNTRPGEQERGQPPRASKQTWNIALLNCQHGAKHQDLRVWFAPKRRQVQGAGCRVQGAGCRVQGAGCRVQNTARIQDITFEPHFIYDWGSGHRRTTTPS